jgi:ABC-type branched-subunit amino acid transport system substrate-binding protein
MPDQPDETSAPGPREVPVLDGLTHEDLDRRRFLEWAGKAGALGVGAVALGSFASATGMAGRAAAATTGRPSLLDALAATPPAGKRTVKGLPKTMKVGIIAPVTGLGAFIGDVVNRGLRAAQNHIKDAKLFPGINVSYVVVDARAEDLAAGAQKAYNQLVADPAVVGIVWATPFGLSETRATVARDGIPVIAVFDDLWSDGQLYPKSPERSIFQMYLPQRKAIEQILKYAKQDRGYTSAGIIYDTVTPPGEATKEYFETAAKKYGLTVAGTEQFNFATADYGAQLARLKAAKPQCLLVWGLAENTAGVVKALDAIGASYVDTPTAKGADWHPQIMGSPGGTGEKKWAALAGDSAKAGSLTCWYLGGFVGLPTFPIRTWLTQYGLGAPTGGEESPANGYWAILEAARLAKSVDRAKVVASLEKLTTVFAGLQFSFTPKRHLSLTDDQLCLVTLERYTGPAKTDPPYVLGQEWPDVFLKVDPQYVGPTVLVRPTLKANRKAYPDTVKVMLEQGYGTECTKTPPDAKSATVKLSKACKVH